MDYEKKYKEEVARATQLWKCGDITRENLEYIFPELAEGKDEKIRKMIINHLTQERGSLSNEEAAEAIAWLEKQGKRSSIWTDNDRIMAFTLLRDVDQMTYISDEGKNERLQWLNSLEDKFNNGE